MHALHTQKEAIHTRYKSRTVLYRGSFGDWATIDTCVAAGSSPTVHAGHNSRAHRNLNSLPMPFRCYSLLPQHCLLLSTVPKRQSVWYAVVRLLQKHFSTRIRSNNAHFNLWDAEAKSFLFIWKIDYSWPGARRPKINTRQATRGYHNRTKKAQKIN